MPSCVCDISLVLHQLQMMKGCAHFCAPIILACIVLYGFFLPYGYHSCEFYGMIIELLVKIKANQGMTSRLLMHLGIFMFQGYRNDINIIVSLFFYVLFIDSIFQPIYKLGSQRHYRYFLKCIFHFKLSFYWWFKCIK